MQQQDLSEGDFVHFFLFVGYDALSERLSDGGAQRMQYRKFVQSNKDAAWAQEVLRAVDRVNQNKELYKKYIPALEERNMGMLARICTSVGSSVMPPVKRVHGMQKCAITNIITDGCIEIHKVSRSAAEKQGDCAIYIGQRFQHFLYMLWTISRVENIVKHHVHEWLAQRKKAQRESLQQVTQAFSEDSKDFCRKLYATFCHAVRHVCTSLQRHLSLQEDPPPVPKRPKKKKKKGIVASAAGGGFSWHPR